MTSQRCKTADELGKMVFKARISGETRAYVRFAKEWRSLSVKQIIQRSHISRASLYRILKEGKIRENNQEHKKKKSIGRPRKLGVRQKRLLLREIPKLRKSEGKFTVKRLMQQAGVSPRHASFRTVQRFLRSQGYKYLQARQKGLLTDKDLKKRLKFARKIKREYNDNLWTEQIAFFLDAVSFIHKFNPADQARAPRGRIWRKEMEGLACGCTAKGSHCGSGGRVAKFVVAITYREGVVLCEKYHRMNGLYFKGLIEREFARMFRDSNKGGSKLFVQDGDPSQNSALARAAWNSIGAEMMPIPPRSGDINCIENIFHIIKTNLHDDALRKNITFETFDQFCARISDTIKSLDKNLIDRTIASMNKRIDLIIANKGQRTKY